MVGVSGNSAHSERECGTEKKESAGERERERERHLILNVQGVSMFAMNIGELTSGVGIGYLSPFRGPIQDSVKINIFNIHIKIFVVRKLGLN